MASYHLKVYKVGVFQYDEFIFEPKKAFEQYNELLENYPFKKEFKREEVKLVIEIFNGQSPRTISPEELETLALESSGISKI